MIDTTYLGTSVFLISDLHNWETPCEVTFEMIAKRISGRTNREERENMAAEIRTTMRFSSLLTSAESTALNAALDAWDNRPVLTPFWPAMARASSPTASVVGGLKVWFEPEFSSFELGTGAAPTGFTPSANCAVAPVLWGRFVDFPELTPINGANEHAVSYEVCDNGPASFAMRPNTVSLTTSVVNTLTVPTLTVPFTWGENKAQRDVRIKRDKVGFGRADADDFLPQMVRTKQTMNFSALNTADLRELLTLFKDRGGSVKPWKCGAVHSPATLSLGRFYGDALKISWEKPAVGDEIAKCSVEFMTLPTEAIALTGETPGVTIGGKPAHWFGYVVSDGNTTWRFTSYESPIVGPGGTFEPRGISHGTITEEINLQVNDCPLEVQNWPGSPFTRLRAQHASPQLEVKIYKGLISDPTAAELKYTGTAQAPQTEGKRWKIKLRGLDSILSIKGPRNTMQTTCGATFGDSRCRFNVASVASTQTYLGTTDGVSEFSTGSVTTLADHRFASGCAKRTLTDGTVQRYLIVDSYKIVSTGNTGCVLAGPVSPPATGSEAGWVLEPGCPGTEAACKGFGNFVNMQAAVRAPKADPKMISVGSNSGGKK